MSRCTVVLQRFRQRAGPQDKEGAPDVPITSAPVDQAAFTRMMLVSVEPKKDRETGVQYTNRDGTEKKWNVQVVVSMVSRFDATRTDSDVLAVTVTTAVDPAIVEGDQVWFEGFSVGVMPPEKTENDRIRGGKLFWTASGVQSRQVANGKRDRAE
jgi:hypothetical protein